VPSPSWPERLWPRLGRRYLRSMCPGLPFTYAMADCAENKATNSPKTTSKITFSSFLLFLTVYGLPKLHLANAYLTAPPFSLYHSLHAAVCFVGCSNSSAIRAGAARPRRRNPRDL